MAYITNTAKTIEGTNVTIQDSGFRQNVDLELKGDTYQEVPILPDGYTQVDYIESDGTQYIDTGITSITKSFAIEIDFSITTSQSYQAIYCCRTDNTYTRSCFVTGLTGFRNDQGYQNPISKSLSLDQKYKLESTETKFIVDGTALVSSITTSKAVNSNMRLLGAYPLGGSTLAYPFYGKLYGCKMWDNNVLIREFVPCYRNSDVEIGLYDLVNNVFYSNNGTGTFGYGSIVERPVQVVTGENTIKVEGKNLLNNTLSSGSKNDIVYVVNPDKSVTLKSGTASAITWLILNNSITLEAGTYTMSQGDTNNTIRMYCGALGGYVNNGVRTQTINETKTSDIAINIPSGTIISSPITIYPMIEKANEATLYEPYKTTTHTINLGTTELCKIGNYQDRMFKGSGKNLLPTDKNLWESGHYDTSGNKSAFATRMRLIELLPVLPNTKYYVLGPAQIIREFDNTKTFTNNAGLITTYGTFTTTANTYYLGVTVDIAYASYNETTSNCALFYNNETNKIWEPYNYYGWLLRKEIGKVVLDGSETWTKSSTYTTNYSAFQKNVGIDNNASISTLYCNNFSNIGFSAPTTAYDYNNIGLNNDDRSLIRLWINVSSLETNNVAGLKTWLNSHNTNVYYVLARPETTKITDTTLIGQLEGLKLYEGVNNISTITSNFQPILKMGYYSIENPYLDVIYSQDEKNDLKIYFNNVELQDADVKCEKITRISRIIPNDGNKVFSLDNFISTSLEIILHNVDLEDIQDQVKISIGTLIDETNNTYEYIPLGIFNIQDTPINDNGKITLKLRDNRVKFDFNYNAQPLIEEQGGAATKKQILDDICLQAGVTNAIDSFNGEEDLIGVYDNTITATTYVAYLMEQAGLIPVIDRQGGLKAIDLSELYIWKIPLSILETGFEIGEPYNIERVCYESGIIKYETSSDESLNTLYLNALNPYISNQSQVQYILNKLQSFLIDSVTTKKVLGNPCIDPYDIIRVYNDIDGTNDIVFETLANTTYTYNGKHRDTFDTQISKENRKENVSLKGEASVKLYAKSSIDNVNARITSEVGQTNANVDNLTSTVNSQGESITTLGTRLTQDVNTINATITGIQEDINEGVEKVKNSLVTIDINGISVSTNLSKISTLITNNSFKIIDSGGNTLAFFGYDENEGISKAEMNNLTVTNYFIAGVHRVETYTENYEERTGWFYIGG